MEALRRHGNVEPRNTPAQAETFAANASHRRSRREASNNGRLPAEPDSMIYAGGGLVRLRLLHVITRRTELNTHRTTNTIVLDISIQKEVPDRY